MDIDYKEALSIAELPVTDPIHKPCPSMAGLESYEPAKTKRACFLISELRKKHGIKKRVDSKRASNPLNYICTKQGCIEPWGAVNNGIEER